QVRPELRERHAERLRVLLVAPGAEQNVVPLEVAAFGHAPELTRELAQLWPQHLADLLLAPDVELALLALAVAVLRAVERPSVTGHLAPLGSGHLVEHIVERLAGDLLVERVAGQLPSLDVG